MSLPFLSFTMQNYTFIFISQAIFLFFLRFGEQLRIAVLQRRQPQMFLDVFAEEADIGEIKLEGNFLNGEVSQKAIWTRHFYPYASTFAFCATQAEYNGKAKLNKTICKNPNIDLERSGEKSTLMACRTTAEMGGLLLLHKLFHTS